MRRRALAGSMVAAAAATVLGLSGCGGSAHHTTSTTTSAVSSPAGPPPPTGTRLSVAPADGHPRSTVRFTLVAPTASGRHEHLAVSYGLIMAGPQGAGCVAQHAAVVDVRQAREAVTAAVGPAQLGAPWCAGGYTARVDELARPVCAPAEPCPQFIRVVAVFGPARFRITP